MKKFESPEIEFIKFLGNEAITTSLHYGGETGVEVDDEEAVDESRIF